MLACALAASLAREARAEDFSLPALMAALAAVADRRASFTQVKTLAALDKPVTSTGTLVYVRPDHLEQTTTTPASERLIAQDHRLSIEAQGQPQRVLDLDQQPEIRALVDTIRGTLSGNLTLLQRYYTVALTGTRAQWRLVLTPADAHMRALVRQVTVDGRGADPLTIDTQQANGDATRLTITPAGS